MTFLLALFLAFAKRRDDVVMYEETGVKARKNVDRYNLEFMNQTIGIVASIMMVCYIMYTVSDEVIARIGSHYLYITSIFVLAGIIRYLQVTIVDVKSGSPTKVLMKDRFIQTCVAGWMITFAIILYC
jgi:4-hydroxybenzoate polyprenyltransferase